MGNLLELVKHTFEEGSKIPRWRNGLLKELEGQIIQFEVSDDRSFYVKIGKEGNWELHEGLLEETPEIETIRAPRAVWEDLFKGQIRFVDAAWNGLLNARIYHGRTDLYFMLSSFIKQAQNIEMAY